MNFCWVTLPVKDFNKSIEFYNGVLGLPICSKQEGRGMQMAMLGEGNQPKIEIIFLESNQAKNFSSDITVGIEVESMEYAMQTLNANNISVLRGPISPIPNIKFIFIKDPDGYGVQLVEIKK